MLGIMLFEMACKLCSELNGGWALRGTKSISVVLRSDEMTVFLSIMLLHLRHLTTVFVPIGPNTEKISLVGYRVHVILLIPEKGYPIFQAFTNATAVDV